MPRLPSQATVCAEGVGIVHGVAKANKHEMAMVCEYCAVCRVLLRIDRPVASAIDIFCHVSCFIGWNNYLARLGPADRKGRPMRHVCRGLAQCGAR